MAFKRINSTYFMADTVEDLNSLPEVEMGTECFVIAEAAEYRVTSDGKWFNQASGSSTPTETPKEEESVDLSKYVTKDELDEALSGIECDPIDLSGYTTKDELKEMMPKPTNKYSFEALPKNTIVDERGKEFRILCPANATYVKQNVGEGGNPNMYYMTFKSFAPEGATYLKEGDRGVIVDEIIELTHSDSYGRKYKPHWFALASYDEASDSWTYFGKNSTTEKFIGWTYIVEWYNENNEMIGTDKIRINLSNLDCHNSLAPYYG